MGARAGSRKVWAHVSGPYLTLALAGVLQLLAQMVPEFPNPAPLLLLAVVYSSFSGGSRGGVISAGIVIAFEAAFLSQPGAPFTYTPRNLAWLQLFVPTVAACVVMVGWLQRRAERSYELAAANARLKELDELKTQFLNNAAHELRTPLTPIKMQMHLLKATGTIEHLDAKQQRALGMMERNIDRLNLLVQDLLEVSRLQAGRLQVDRELVDVHKLAAEAVESFQEQARAGGVSLELRGQPGRWVEADPKRVIQVLFNLLSNALKFTPQGGRVVLEAQATGGRCVVRVADTGRGLRREAIGKLFQPFAQVQEASEVPVPGTGLGLYICKGIVEQHGGAIWAESAGPGKGSTFVFSLPAAAVAPEPAPRVA